MKQSMSEQSSRQVGQLQRFWGQFWGLLGFALVLAIFVPACTARSADRRAHEGVLALQDWQPDDGVVALQGSWGLYWRRLLEPTDFRLAAAHDSAVTRPADSLQQRLEPDFYADMPQAWTQLEHDGERLPRNGFATLRLRLQLPEQSQSYGLRLPRMVSSYRLWFDGREIAQAGTVGRTADTTRPSHRVQTVFFDATGGEVDILLQIANFEALNGGMRGVLRFGSAAAVRREQMLAVALELFLVGASLVFGLYHLSFFLVRRSDITTFYFGLFCLALVLFILTTGEAFALELWPGLPWLWHLKLENLAYPLLVPLLLLFFRQRYPQDLAPWSGMLARRIALIFTALVLLTPPAVFVPANALLAFLLVFMALYIVYGLVMAAWRQRRGARLELGCVLLLAGATGTGMLFSLGLWLFIFAETLNLAALFARAFRKVETMSELLEEANRGLERKVEARTSELAARIDQLNTLNRISQALTAVNSLQVTLRNAAKEMVELFAVRSSGIALLNESRDTLTVVADYSRHQDDGSAVGITIRLVEAALSAQVVHQGRAVIVPSPRTHPDMAPSHALMRERGIELLIVLPLFARGEVIGTVGIDIDEAARNFSEDELALAETVAQQMAGAIENAQLFSEMQRAREETERANAEISLLNARLEEENMRMSAEIDITRRLQQLILPKTQELAAIEGLDIAASMESADEVGGDYYDVLQRAGQVKIAIGDVTGHGLESGILMLMTQTAVRTLLEHNEDDPTVFLATLNRTIYNNVQRINSDKNLSFAMLDYCRLEPQLDSSTSPPAMRLAHAEGAAHEVTMTLERQPQRLAQGQLVLSGQHEELLLVRHGGEIERLDTLDLGFPVGLTDDIAPWIDQCRLELASGDGVVLYTDGVTEAENDTGEAYGLERLCACISRYWQYDAERVRQAISDEVYAHIGSHKIYDDITLLVIKQR